MACGPCEKRRQMLAQARKQAGLKGVVKSIPSIVRDTIKNPPKLKGKRNG